MWLAALILKTSFSLKGLLAAGIKIRNLLKEEKLAEARFELRALVGRNTSQLDKSQHGLGYRRIGGGK